MIETFLIEYLNKKMSVPVYAEVPHDKDEFVVIEKTGSGEFNKIYSQTIAFQSYSSKSMLRAIEINEELKQAVNDSIECEEISKAKLNSDYNFTDTSTKFYRYQALYDLVVLF